MSNQFNVFDLYSPENLEDTATKSYTPVLGGPLDKASNLQQRKQEKLANLTSKLDYKPATVESISDMDSIQFKGVTGGVGGTDKKTGVTYDLTGQKTDDRQIGVDAYEVRHDDPASEAYFNSDSGKRKMDRQREHYATQNGISADQVTDDMVYLAGMNQRFDALDTLNTQNVDLISRTVNEDGTGNIFGTEEKPLDLEVLRADTGDHGWFGRPLTDVKGVGGESILEKFNTPEENTDYVGPVESTTEENPLEALMKTLKTRESSDQYNAENKLGYIGAYQFGAARLEDLGVVKKGTKNSDLDNPDVWTGKYGVNSKDEFLENTNAQDAIAADHFNNLAKQLESSATDQGDLLGKIAAAHLLGVDGSKNLDSTDANNTSGREYYELGKGVLKGMPSTSQTGNAEPDWANMSDQEIAAYVAGQKEETSSESSFTNGLKALGYKLSDAVANTIDLVPEIAEYAYNNTFSEGQDWADTEGFYKEEHKEAYKEWLGYNEKVMQNLGKEATDAFRAAWQEGDYTKAAEVVWKGVQTWELAGETAGFLLGLVLPGAAAKRGVQLLSGVNKSAKALMAADTTGKLTKAQALAQAEQKAGVGYRMASTIAGNVGYANEAEQFGRRAEAEHMELYGEEMSNAQKIAIRPLGFLYAKIDGIMDKAIILGKDPIAKGIQALIKKSPVQVQSRLVYKIAQGAGVSVGRVAGAMGLEGVTEYIQANMEQIAGQYKADVKGLVDVVTDDENIISAGGEGLLGAAGGTQLAAPSTVADVATTGYGKVKEAQKQALQKDSYDAVNNTQEEYDKAVADNDLTAAGVKYKELVALEDGLTRTEDGKKEREKELAAIKVDLYNRAKAAIAERTKTLGASKDDKDAVDAQYELGKKDRKEVAKQLDTLMSTAATPKELEEATEIAKDLESKGAIRGYEVDSIIQKVVDTRNTDADAAKLARLLDAVDATDSAKNKQKFQTEIDKLKTSLRDNFGDYNEGYNPYKNNGAIKKKVGLTEEKEKEVVAEFIGDHKNKEKLAKNKVIQAAAIAAYGLANGQISVEDTIDTRKGTKISAKEAADIAERVAKKLMENDQVSSTVAMNEAIVELASDKDASDNLRAYGILLDKNKRTASVEQTRGRTRTRVKETEEGSTSADLVELEPTFREVDKEKRDAEGTYYGAKQSILGALKGFKSAKYDAKQAKKDRSKVGIALAGIASEHEGRAVQKLRENLNAIYNAIDNQEDVDVSMIDRGVTVKSAKSKQKLAAIKKELNDRIASYSRGKAQEAKATAKIDEKGLDRRTEKQKVHDKLEDKTEKLENTVKTIEEEIVKIENSDDSSKSKEFKVEKKQESINKSKEKLALIKKVFGKMDKDIAKAKALRKKYAEDVDRAKKRLAEIEEEMDALHVASNKDAKAQIEAGRKELDLAIEAKEIANYIAAHDNIDVATILLNSQDNIDLADMELSLLEEAYLSVREGILTDPENSDADIERKLTKKTLALVDMGPKKLKWQVATKEQTQKLAEEKRLEKAKDLAGSIIELKELISAGSDAAKALSDRIADLIEQKKKVNAVEGRKLDEKIEDLKTRIATIDAKVDTVKEKYLTEQSSLESTIGKHWKKGGKSIIQELQAKLINDGNSYAETNEAYKKNLEEKKSRETDPTTFVEFRKQSSMLMNLDLEKEELVQLKEHAISLNNALVAEIAQVVTTSKKENGINGIVEVKNYATPYDDRVLFALMDTTENADGESDIHLNLNSMLVLDKVLYEFITTDAGSNIINDYETVQKMLSGAKPTAKGKQLMKKHLKDGNFLRLVVESLGKKAAADLGIAPTETSDGTGKEPDTEFYMTLGHKVLLLGQAKGVFERNLKPDGDVKGASATIPAKDAKEIYNNENAKDILMVRVKGKGVKAKINTLDKYLLSKHGIVAGALSEVFEDPSRQKAPHITPSQTAIENLRVNKAEVLTKTEDRVTEAKRKYLEGQGKKPWKFNTKVYEKLKEDLDADPVDTENYNVVPEAWAALGFLEIPAEATAMTTFEKDRRMAVNAGLLRELSHLENWYNRHITKGRGEALYFSYRMDSENRLRQDSNTINTEQSLIHRFIVTPENGNTISRGEFEGYVVPEDSSKADVRLEGIALGILQGLGIDIESRKRFNEDAPITKKELVEIGVAVMQMPKAELNKMLAQMDAKPEGKVVISGIEVPYDGVEHNAQFRTTKEIMSRYAEAKPGDKLPFELIAEYDAKTNAFGYKALQVVKTRGSEINAEGNSQLANKVYIDFKGEDGYVSGDSNIVDYNNENRSYDMYENAGAQATKATEKTVSAMIDATKSKNKDELKKILKHTYEDFSDYEKEFEAIRKELRQAFKQVILPVQYASTLQSAVDGFARSISESVPQELLDMANELKKKEDITTMAEVEKALEGIDSKYKGVMTMLLQTGVDGKKPIKATIGKIIEALTNENASTWDAINIGDLTGTKNYTNMDQTIRDMVRMMYKQSIGTAFFNDVGHIIESNRMLTNTSKAMTHVFIYKLDKAIEQAEAGGKKLNKAQKALIAKDLADKELFPLLKTEMGDKLEAIDTEKTEGTDTTQVAVSNKRTGKDSETLNITKKQFIAATASAAVLTTLASDAQVQATFADRIGNDNFLNMFDAVAGDITKLGGWASESNKVFAEVALKSDPFYSMLDTYHSMLTNLTEAEKMAINNEMRVLGLKEQKYVPLDKEFSEGIDNITGEVRMLNDVTAIEAEYVSDAVLSLEDAYKELYDFTYENASNRYTVMGKGIKVNHFDFGRQSQVEISGNEVTGYLNGIYGNDMANITGKSPTSTLSATSGVEVSPEVMTKVNEMFKTSSEVVKVENINTLVEDTMDNVKGKISVAQNPLRKLVKSLAEEIIRYDNTDKKKLLKVAEDSKIVGMNTGTDLNTFNDTTIGIVLDVMLGQDTNESKSTREATKAAREKIQKCS